ncbi:MAG: hypothetical protein V1740_00240 [Candidatus Woesearchaeota archaeon]
MKNKKQRNGNGILKRLTFHKDIFYPIAKVRQIPTALVEIKNKMKIKYKKKAKADDYHHMKAALLFIIMITSIFYLGVMSGSSSGPGSNSVTGGVVRITGMAVGGLDVSSWDDQELFFDATRKLTIIGKTTDGNTINGYLVEHIGETDPRLNGNYWITENPGWQTLGGDLVAIKWDGNTGQFRRFDLVNENSGPFDDDVNTLQDFIQDYSSAHGLERVEDDKLRTNYVFLGDDPSNPNTIIIPPWVLGEDSFNYRGPRVAASAGTGTTYGIGILNEQTLQPYLTSAMAKSLIHDNKNEEQWRDELDNRVTHDQAVEALALIGSSQSTIDELNKVKAGATNVQKANIDAAIASIQAKMDLIRASDAPMSQPLLGTTVGQPSGLQPNQVYRYTHSSGENIYRIDSIDDGQGNVIVVNENGAKVKINRDSFNSIMDEGSLTYIRTETPQSTPSPTTVAYSTGSNNLGVRTIVDVLNNNQGKYDLILNNPNVAIAVAQVESSLNVNTPDSVTGAVGLFQVQPSTAVDVLGRTDPAIRAINERYPDPGPETPAQRKVREDKIRAALLDLSTPINLNDPKTSTELGLVVLDEQIKFARTNNPDLTDDQILQIAVARYYSGTGPDGRIKTWQDYLTATGDQETGPSIVAHVNKFIKALKEIEPNLIQVSGTTPTGIFPIVTLEPIVKLEPSPEYLQQNGQPLYVDKDGNLYASPVADPKNLFSAGDALHVTIRGGYALLQPVPIVEGKPGAPLDEYYISPAGSIKDPTARLQIMQQEFNLLTGLPEGAEFEVKHENNGDLVIKAGPDTIRYVNHKGTQFDGDSVFKGTVRRTNDITAPIYYDENGNRITASKFEANNGLPDDEKKLFIQVPQRSTITTEHHGNDLVYGEHRFQNVEIKEGKIIDVWTEISRVNEEGREIFFVQPDKLDRTPQGYWLKFDCGIYAGCEFVGVVNPDNPDVTISPSEAKISPQDLAKYQKLGKQYSHRRFFSDATRSLTQFRGLAGFSSLFIPDETLQEWREKVDQAFAKMYLGTEYWASKICASNIVLDDESLVYIETPDGLIGIAAHIEGEKIESPDLANNSMRYVYKISYFVQNHPSAVQSEGFRLNDQDMVFNVEVIGPGVRNKIYPEDIELGTGQIKRVGPDNLLVKESPYNYDKVCIVFETPIRTFGESFSTESRDEVCNKFSKYTGGPTTVRTPSQVSGTGTSDW